MDQDKDYDAAQRQGKWRIAVALGLVVALVGIIVAYRQMDAPETTALTTMEPSLVLPEAPDDPDLALFNALGLHFYSLKNDAGSFEQLRSNLSGIALSAGTDGALVAFHGTLLDACRDCELFFTERKELDDARREWIAEVWKTAAKRTGSYALGAAARETIFGTNALTLSATGTYAAAQGAQAAWRTHMLRREFDESVGVAWAELNDAFARVGHDLTNIRAAHDEWPESAVLSEADFYDYSQALGRLSAGDQRAAIPHLQRAAGLPGLAEALFFLGLAHEVDGNFAQAAEAYQLAIERQPKNFVFARQLVAEAQGRLARLALREQQWDEALRHARAALEAGGDSGAFFGLFGDVLLGGGHTREAIDAYRQALALEPDLPRVPYALAQALAAVGEDEEAMEWMDKARASGAVDLDEAAENRYLAGLQTLPRFQEMVRLEFEAYIDWGPISDKLVVANRNLFAVTNVEIIATRLNEDAPEMQEVMRVERIEPGDFVKAAGAIAKGPKSRTRAFACRLTCDQGSWEARIDLEAPAEMEE